MAQPEPMIAALIGDMVGSRKSPDRARLQEQVGAVLDTVDRVVGGRPTFTIGDEFQASYPGLGEAIEASIQLHLRSLGLIRLRIGIGWGELVAEDPARAPFGQDGPCWWRAREAIETVAGSERGRGPVRRTALRSGTDLDQMLDGYLLLRDTLLDGMDEIDARIAIGLIEGRSQTELAGATGLNKSSVSRRAHGHGILALVRARHIGTLPVPS